MEIANGEYETLGDGETTIIIFSANLRLKYPCKRNQDSTRAYLPNDFRWDSWNLTKILWGVIFKDNLNAIPVFTHCCMALLCTDKKNPHGEIK